MPVKSDPRQWTDPRHVTGLEGEELAIRYLERRGWDILDHRYRMGRLEIDIVARQGCTVAFVEVKTRWSRAFGDPLEAVTWTKKREIERVAKAWVDRCGTAADRYRFDVIGVSFRRGRRPRIEHVQDAFRAGWR